MKALIKIEPVSGCKPIKNLAEIGSSNGCYAFVAIIFIDTTSKLSIFDEMGFIKRNKEMTVYDDLTYYVEDESCRIEAVFEKEMFFITGQVFGFIANKESSVLKVKSVIYPDELKPTKNMLTRGICFVGDVQISSNTSELKLILDFVKKNKKVSDLVVVGNLFSKYTKENVDLLSELVKSLGINVFIIPNKNDPTSSLLPQKPISKKLVNIDCNFLSNPAQFDVGPSFLYMPSVITEDIKLYKNNTTIDIMKFLIKTRHVCPNAPDTIGCLPYIDEDPFILYKFPEYAFTLGDEFKMEQDTTICFIVPSFSKTKSAVVLSQKRDGFEIISLKH